MTNSFAVALNLCRRSMDRSLTTSEVKLASWLVAAADKLGGFPVEFSLREIKDGCVRNETALPGWGAHHNTIKAATEGLMDKGLFLVSDGRRKHFGHMSRVFLPTSLLGG